ncbi:M23 family metallopeptidase [Brevibacillus centrosporus]|jgi:murein DD-endopeptidase MepM/ murein hydrolase activator NlpD|uniref:LysM peptidoglycan-binding domain-containing M23 family metallopeptidase n=1 Tax=Brevibacillus centrosporus TaxID=54910 RepID=UPI003987D343
MDEPKWLALLREKVNHTLAIFAKNKKLKLMVGFFLLLTTSGFAYVDHIDNNHMVTVYQLKLNGKEIGAVSSPDVVQKWLDVSLRNSGAKNYSQLKLDDQITFQEQKLFNGVYDNDAAIEALSKETELRVSTVKVEVGGTTVGYAINQQEVQKALAQLKQRYVSNSKSKVAAASIDSQKSEVKEVKFKETVSMQQSTAPAPDILSSDKLLQVLTNGLATPIIHTVRKGDCLGCIANEYGVKLSEILDNNPEINENSLLQLGQEINITVSQPLLTVKVTEEVEQNERVPYQLETRTSSLLPKGQTRVIQPGKEGMKRATYQVIKENGKIIERNLIQEETIEKPVTKIVEQGTKTVSISSSGNMTWPANGVLTSRYGQRWGRLHKGLDIAGSGSIQATESGKVVLAGWYGDYGNAVIIDHGNGVQTLYGHMKSIRVSEGERVNKGTSIGIMGSTGDSTGVHVHFEVRKGGKIENPMNYLKR